MTVHIAIPILREFSNIPRLLSDIGNQDYNDIKCWFCVNNPEEWHEDVSHAADIEDNRKTLDYLNKNKDENFTVIDKSSRGRAFPLKNSGVGWARKVLFDKIAGVADDNDLIISMDADTCFGNDYVSSVMDNFRCHKNVIALCVPYYHPLTGDEKQDSGILRYELYMRHYMVNMLRINNPYSFTALGSAMAFPVKSYRKVRGITPRQSGEDFYLLQKFRKSGELLLWNDSHVYPMGRCSDRVAFGTGPALIKGLNGDWSSYPFYNPLIFDEVKQTFDSFNCLYHADIEMPMMQFLKNVFKTEDLWGPLRKNYTTEKAFIHACMVKVDALRILQYLRYRQQSVEAFSVEVSQAERDRLYEIENELRKSHDDTIHKLTL